MLENEKKRVWEVAQSAFGQGLCIEGAGNFSLYDPGSGYVVCTPSGIPRAELEPEGIMVIDLEGGIVEGPYRPTSEWPVHTMIYRGRPDLRGAVHTHSAYASCFAIMNREIPPIHNPMWKFGGAIPVATWALPGTADLGEAVMPLLEDTDVVLLKNHGLLAVGSSVERALATAMLAEDSAMKYYLVLSTGSEPEVLTEQQIELIRDTVAKRKEQGS